MSDSGGCPGLQSNPDISGLGVRVALYLQSLLSVVLVRISPKDAPGAYWAMTSTAFSLIISSFVTAANGSISLLDAIVVVYVLILPVLASAFGLSEIVAHSTRKNHMRSVHSPLLIVANWTRSALTYSFALYVWISAPSFGSGQRECNEATRLIFFGASLPALGSGRILNLVGWGLLTLLFAWRTIKGLKTIIVATKALFSSTASQALLKPKHPPKNEVHRETVTRINFATGEKTTTSRLFRPRQIFHELVKSVMGQIVGLGSGRWYRAYGRTVLIGLMAAWAITMTELELILNELEEDPNAQWGFGQILPLVLTISPLFSLYESILSRRSSGPKTETRVLRFSINHARGLVAPQSDLDFLPAEIIKTLNDEQIKALGAPSPFAVITVDERVAYTTFERDNVNDPDWDESFDITVGDLSTVVIRIFDRKCIDRGWPSFIGFTTILPFTMLPPPRGDQIPVSEDPGASDSSVDMDSIPLVREGMTMPDMTVSISLSTDTRSQPSLPYMPPTTNAPEGLHVQKRVAMVQWGKHKAGGKKVTTTRVYQMQNLEE